MTNLWFNLEKFSDTQNIRVTNNEVYRNFEKLNPTKIIMIYCKDADNSSDIWDRQEYSVSKKDAQRMIKNFEENAVEQAYGTNWTSNKVSVHLIF
jgi:galactokinase/mevalonate kinase-like predicted kinase